MAPILKPRVVQDVEPKSGRSFKFLKPRLNLRGRRVLAVSAKPIVKTAVVVAAAALFFGSAAAPTVSVRADQAASSSDSGAAATSTDRAALEAQLSDLEAQINRYETQASGYAKQGKTLKNEIYALNSKIVSLNLQIRAIDLTLRDLNGKISDVSSQIASTESSIDTHKQELVVLIRNLYESEGTSMVQVFLSRATLSDFFSDLSNIVLLQNGVRGSIAQLSALRDQLSGQKEQLALSVSDAETVKEYHNAEKLAADSVKTQKDQLLRATKGQESKYLDLVQKTKETAAQIRNRIFQLLGGGELSFEQAYEYAKLASGATGVDPALVLAVLDRESALGQNVGKCSYKTAMSPSNQALFLQIASELGLNPDIMTVSCPNRDGVYGGAMGPAQFVPSTWNLYKDLVAKTTGHEPPSPWNNADAFVATALYLKDALSGCQAVYSSELSQNRCAAAKYYAGGRWRNYLWTYGQAVVNQAQQFTQDIQTITSG